MNWVIIWFPWCSCRSSDCFSLGWPMRDDGDFFKSTRNKGQVVLYSNSCQCLTQIIPFVLHLMLLIFQGRKAVQRKSGSTGKSNFVEMRSFWHLFRSFDRLWTFYILALQVSSSSRNSKLLILLCVWDLLRVVAAAVTIILILLTREIITITMIIPKKRNQ